MSSERFIDIKPSPNLPEIPTGIGLIKPVDPDTLARRIQSSIEATSFSLTPEEFTKLPVISQMNATAYEVNTNLQGFVPQDQQIVPGKVVSGHSKELISFFPKYGPDISNVHIRRISGSISEEQAKELLAKALRKPVRLPDETVGFPIEYLQIALVESIDGVTFLEIPHVSSGEVLGKMQISITKEQLNTLVAIWQKFQPSTQS